MRREISDVLYGLTIEGYMTIGPAPDRKRFWSVSIKIPSGRVVAEVATDDYGVIMDVCMAKAGHGHLVR